MSRGWQVKKDSTLANLTLLTSKVDTSKWSEAVPNWKFHCTFKAPRILAPRTPNPCPPKECRQAPGSRSAIAQLPASCYQGSTVCELLPCTHKTKPQIFPLSFPLNVTTTTITASPVTMAASKKETPRTGLATVSFESFPS